MTWRVRNDATPYLRVRCKPSGDIIGRFAPGRELDVRSVAGGWAQVRVDTAIDVYVSSQFIEQVGVPTTFRKIGLHLHTGGNVDACVRAYDDCARAGKPIAVAVVINNPALVDAIKRVSPETFVVARLGVVGGPDVLPLVKDDNMVNFLAGENRFNERYAPCSADAYQVANEHYSGAYPAWKVTAMAHFYLGVMAAAKGRNKLATIGDFSTGTPEDEHLELMTPMLAKAENDGHVLNYHAYAAPDIYDMTYQAEWWAMRWLRITRNYPRLRVLNGEFGGYHHNGPDIMAMIRQYQAMTATYDTLIGAATFTAMAAPPWSENGFNFDPHVQGFAAWHRSL